ncbi:DUF3108 domain-containing protein [Massilia sp. TSP1-1-2]|uniref:DUF3108 domain-containing protein n=1 Tax=unclassified Massilia TaxID=2609279 RepID=UPI003CFA6C16
MIKRCTAGAVLMGVVLGAWAQEHASVKRPVDLPPSADLTYKIEARKKGISLSGEAQVNWRVGAGRYSAGNTARAQLLGKILDNRSEGLIDVYGLAPLQFREKRFRKDQTIATFDRAAKTIVFNDGKLSYPLTGGEQDRGSVQWQLAAVGRGAPEKFTPGSEWKFFVAGRRDAEMWTFKVVNREMLKTGMGTLPTVHLVKSPSPDARGQSLDLWLAPSLEWYPVKLRFAEEDGEFVEQTLDKLVKK